MRRRRVQGTDFQEQLGQLKAKIALLKDQLNDVRGRIEELGPATRVVRYAVVNRLRCTGCNLCAHVCPVGAINVTYVARGDRERCTGCGICVPSCRQGALSLARMQGPESPQNLSPRSRSRELLKPLTEKEN